MSDEVDIAILCPGPGLVDFLGRPRSHTRFIGVNRAATAWPCDYWAFNDHEVFGWYHAQVQRNDRKPVCFTSNRAFELLGDPPAATDFEWLFYSQIETSCPSDPGWTHYTLTVAMVLAEYLIRKRFLNRGADDASRGSVIIYGCDWSGTQDWDGADPPRDAAACRSEYRWKNEQHKFWHVMRWLNQAGVDVIRVGSTQAAGGVG